MSCLTWQLSEAREQLRYVLLRDRFVRIPLSAGKYDDETNEPLYQRKDDNATSLKKRLESYYGKTLPVLERYQDQVVTINADQKPGEAWKCLMAPYIASYVKTPYFVLNSAYDAWQMGSILATPCLPAPNRAPCSAAQNATLRAYHDDFLKAIKAVTQRKVRSRASRKQSRTNRAYRLT